MEFIKKTQPAKYSDIGRFVLTYTVVLLNVRDTNEKSWKTLHVNNEYEPAFENRP